MAFIPTPNTAKLELRYDYHDVACENVLHFEFASPPTAGRLETLCNLVRDWWIDDLKPQQPGTVLLREIYARGMDAQAAPQYAVQIGQFGGMAGAGMPGSVTFCLKLITGLTGRWSRGRLYHIGLIESEVTANELLLSRAQALMTAYAQLGTLASAEGATWVVNSLYFNKNPRPAGVNTPITNVTYTDLGVDTQRRRLR